MKAVDLVNFFKSPTDRDVISRWTTPPGPRAYAIDMPALPDPERFTFLAFGDTGDSAGMGSRESPQDAVARFLAQDAALPGSTGAGQFVLHTGDVVYMTGERRLYDRNFRRPYADFLTPESTVDNLTFRIPFLPVPGNHDYYDFSGWGAWLSRVPLIGRGIAALARELFSMQVPQGGSDMGAAYMQAFVDPESEKNGDGYRLGTHTRLPNRYYRFRAGSVDFFALDSNTLEAPPPYKDLAAEREAAAKCVTALEARAATLTAQIQRDQKALEAWLELERHQAAQDVNRLDVMRQAALAVTGGLDRLDVALAALGNTETAPKDVMGQAQALEKRWAEATEPLLHSRKPARAAEALEELADLSDDLCRLLEELEHCYASLPEGPERDELLASQQALEQANESWCRGSSGAPPADLCDRLQTLSASALDVQRQLALERRRMDRQPEDYDAAQLQWLQESLDESVRDNPDGWRVVYLHQPLYTSIGDHSENPDVVGVRENLTPLLRDRVHLVLAGHAHAFEWFRSSTLPHTGLIVTGGGGQHWLWPSILEPKRLKKFQNLYHSLRSGGAVECVAAGNGPSAADGAAGALYHYVRVEVTPEALIVHPVGVRKVDGTYRKEEPMPVFHVPEFPADIRTDRPDWNRRVVKAVEVRRGQPPKVRWA